MGHEPSLIEDVVMPPTDKFTDPGREVVRRRSIGNLHQQYLRRRKQEEAKSLPRPHYSIVPPLRTLHADSGSLPDFSAASLLSMLLILSAPVELAKGLGRKFSGATGKLPKKYSAASGVATDWETTAWKARYAVPVILILFILGLLLSGLFNGSKHRPGQTANKPASITQVPVTAAKAVGGKGGSGGSSSVQSPSAAAVQNPNNLTGSSPFGFNSISGGTTSGSGGSGSTSGTGGTVGGMGGGPTGGGAGGTSGGSGSGGSVFSCVDAITGARFTCTYQTCTPPVALSNGQKAYLTTNDWCVVVN